MNLDELRRQLDAEFEQIHLVLLELEQLETVLNRSDCSVRDKAAAATFLSQCYMGIENILKRILVYCGINRPTGPDSHIELAKLFGPRSGSSTTIPVLFDEELFQELSGLRRLRHFVAHGYSFSLNREILFESAVRVGPLISGFKATIRRYIDSQAENIELM